MKKRILRGVRVATPTGIQAASVHVAGAKVVALAGYDEIPREATAEELGKSILMAAPAALIGMDATQRNFVFLELSRAWTQMRNRDESIELFMDKVCPKPLQVKEDAHFLIWNPEMYVVGSQPILYGQIRQYIEYGKTLFKDGTHFPHTETSRS